MDGETAVDSSGVVPTALGVTAVGTVVVGRVVVIVVSITALGGGVGWFQAPNLAYHVNLWHLICLICHGEPLCLR